MKTSSYFPAKVKQGLDKFFHKSSMTRLVSPKARLLCCAQRKNTLTEWARQISLLSGQTVSKQALWERSASGGQ